MSNVEAHLPTIQCVGEEVARRLFDAVKDLVKAHEANDGIAETTAIAKLYKIAEWIEAASDRISHDHGCWDLSHNAAIFDHDMRAQAEHERKMGMGIDSQDAI